jgi:hypothetical protein
MKWSLALLGGLGGLIMATVAHAGVGRVWAVNDGEKVDRGDLKNVNRDKNSAWDGTTVRIFGGRNEVIAFQVIVESDDKGIEGLSASLPELAGPGGGKISYVPPREDPTDFVGRQIQVFSAHYINVKEVMTCSWIFDRKSPAAPANPTGWKPVVLVPEDAAAGKGGFPLKVAANNTQAIWFEIYTPRDLPAGTYRGTVTVKASGQTMSLPVELEVFAFVLPDQNSMKAMLYFETSQLNKYHGADLEDRYQRFGHRQRVELVHAYSEAEVMQDIGWFNGNAFTKGNGYEGPGEGVGNVIVPATFYGPGNQYDDKASAHKASDAWMTFLNNNVPGAMTFLYLPDEPSRRDFPRILKIGENIHKNPGPGGKLPVFVTHEINKDLAPAIDIWSSPTEAYKADLAAKETEAGKIVSVYNGHRPHAGSFDYSVPATDPRATIWGCFKFSIPLYFYWHANHWEHNFQKPTDRDQNIWANSITFDNRKQVDKPGGGFANGDGVLLYPGQEKVHPEEDRDIVGPCGGYHLANLRRGLQDHLYLTMARELGLKDVVEQTTGAVAGKMLSEAEKTIGFAQTGNEFEAARLKLAQAIVAAKKAK